jgi:hypothetical protein
VLQFFFLACDCGKHVNLYNRLSGQKIKERDDVAKYNWCVLVECDRECDHSMSLFFIASLRSTLIPMEFVTGNIQLTVDFYVS